MRQEITLHAPSSISIIPKFKKKTKTKKQRTGIEIPQRPFSLPPIVIFSVEVLRVWLSG